MTVQVKLTGLPGPSDKAAHVELFKHEDRQQIVTDSFLLQDGEERTITLYEGVGFRVEEVEVEEDTDQDQAEIPELVHPAPADSTPEK